MYVRFVMYVQYNLDLHKEIHFNVKNVAIKFEQILFISTLTVK